MDLRRYGEKGYGQRFALIVLMLAAYCGYCVSGFFYLHISFSLAQSFAVNRSDLSLKKPKTHHTNQVATCFLLRLLLMFDNTDIHEHSLHTCHITQNDYMVMSPIDYSLRISCILLQFLSIILFRPPPSRNVALSVSRNE